MTIYYPFQTIKGYTIMEPDDPDKMILVLAGSSPYNSDTVFSAPTIAEAEQWINNLKPPHTCECDNTHDQNHTVCQRCYDAISGAKQTQRAK